MKYLIEPAGVGGHAQALDMLGRLLGEENPVLEHDSMGAPYLPQYSSVHVSISHCRTAVAVALSLHGKVGIDVESRRKVNPSLIHRVCTEAECTVIEANADPIWEFLHLWTRKEAVLKCVGTGIRGFGSMQQALQTPGITVQEIPCPIADTVAALAFTAE